MKLYLIFLLIDVLVLLAYPILYMIHKIRKIFQIKR